MNLIEILAQGKWTVDTDPECEEAFSVFLDNGEGASAELAGRICEKAVAKAIAELPALIKTLQRARDGMAALSAAFDAGDIREPYNDEGDDALEKMSVAHNAACRALRRLGVA